MKIIGGTQLSVDDVIVSNGRYTLSDIYAKYHLKFYCFIYLCFEFCFNYPFLIIFIVLLQKRYDVTNNGNFYYQSRPAAGYYCIYAKRPNETGWGVPDCPSILLSPSLPTSLILSWVLSSSLPYPPMSQHSVYCFVFLWCNDRYTRHNRQTRQGTGNSWCWFHFCWWHEYQNNGKNIKRERIRSRKERAGREESLDRNTKKWPNVDIPTYGSGGDVLQLRPMEILFEQWGKFCSPPSCFASAFSPFSSSPHLSALFSLCLILNLASLRKSGIPTPKITAWGCLPTGKSSY